MSVRRRSACLRFALIPVPVLAGVLVSLLAEEAFAQSFGPRQVAAPPEDILSGRLRLPAACALRTLSKVAAIPVDFAPAGDGWAFEIVLPIDGPGGGPGSAGLDAGGASFALAAPDASNWTLSLTRPDGRLVDLARDLRSGAIVRRGGELEGPLRGLVAERYDLARAERGTWTVRVEAAGARPAPGFLLASGGGELYLASHLSTLELCSDRRIGVVASVVDGPDPAAAPRAGLVAKATLRVDSAVGDFALAMFDDGRHADGAEADGVFGAFLPGGVSGEVTAQVAVEGVSDAGLAFLRTTRHAFTVLEPRCVLTGAATTRVLSAHELALDIGAVLLAGRPRLHLSAEVWGTDPAGALAPACWLSRLIELDPAGPDETALRLVLDARWLNRAGLAAPLELRHVRVQDPDTHVPYALRRRIQLAAGPLPPLVGREPTPITPDMQKSSVLAVSGVELLPGSYAELTGAVLRPRALLLTHGFCSSNVWGAAAFSPPRLDFLDLGQGRTHDQFAQLLLQFGASAHSYGIVAHSQGGAAALQLYTYYASGLDLAVGPRRIQSVGTPYQGTPLAELGGATCGVIADLTPAGANVWLAGIPTWARAEVHYWTTSNSGFFACNVLSDFLLANPDDGVIEMFRGQLPGGNSMGHTTGWCHSTGMSNPAHYTDAARNAEMDAQAAR